MRRIISNHAIVKRSVGFAWSTSAAARRSTPRSPPPGAWAKVAPAAAREELRRAFARWGPPRRLRVGDGAPRGSWGDFPTALSLRALGLDVAMHWNNPRSPEENGAVERSQGTSSRWCEPWTCATPEELQGRLVRMGRLYREPHPYRNRLGRTAFSPGLAHSGRPCDPDLESEPWRWSRVAERLASCAARRLDGSTRPGMRPCTTAAVAWAESTKASRSTSCTARTGTSGCSPTATAASCGACPPRN
jgi:hypothetical protein